MKIPLMSLPILSLDKTQELEKMITIFKIFNNQLPQLTEDQFSFIVECLALVDCEKCSFHHSLGYIHFSIFIGQI